MKILKIGKWGQHEVLLDDEDYEWVSKLKWHGQKCHTSKMIYAVRWEWDGRGKRIRYMAMHREILGVKGSHITIDHRDRNSLNNQKSNLRICPRKGFNQANQPAQRGRKWKGVEQLRLTPHRWRARIAGKHIATYASAEEAARGYDEAAIKKWGEFAYLNFPNQPTP